MKQIVFNSFPRSGNVYQGAACRHFFGINQALVHMPEIFGVDGLYNVTIFRKPEDAIASLVMKESEHGSEIGKSGIYEESVKKVKYYKEYMESAKINQEKIYIGKFDNLISDTVKHFEDISKKFNLKLNNDYQKKFLNEKLSGKMWDDRYDGHLPREKDSLRLKIEETVKEFSFIQELNEEYDDFISHYATVV
jgi:hypothetical protein